MTPRRKRRPRPLPEIPAERLQEVNQWLIDQDVDDVEVMVTDFAGIPRGKAMPRLKFIESIQTRGLRLPESIFSMTVSGEYVYQGLVPVTEPDVLLLPQLDTLVLVPWQNEPTACVICDAYYGTGQPVPFNPREVLRRVIALYERKGWRPVIAPEFEFYLLARRDEPDAPPAVPRGRSGRVDCGIDSFSIDGVDEFGVLFDDIYDFCETQRIAIDTLVHEAGPAQFEFNLRHGDPLALADQSFYLKRLIRQAAIKHGMFASFMAKPYPDHMGSSMHIHQSVEDMATGRNLFADDAGEDTELFHYHIGGLQKYLPAAMPLLAPYMNSYRRIAPGMSAPVNTHWGRENRTVGLRVPISGPENRRVENRIAGADVNPYLAIAASLACGYLGMVEQIRPSRPLRTSAYEKKSRTLPLHYLEGLEELEDCEELADVLGAEFVKLFVEVKKLEYHDYYSVLSPWEIRHLMLNI
ncbi:MAG: glutamine synthetase [Alphaproteobacteria bacterium]|nr:MAG: glutamine synthetase [Alphaproteobacteria bacterium]